MLQLSHLSQIERLFPEQLTRLVIYILYYFCSNCYNYTSRSNIDTSRHSRSALESRARPWGLQAVFVVDNDSRFKFENVDSFCSSLFWRDSWVLVLWGLWNAAVLRAMRRFLWLIKLFEQSHWRVQCNARVNKQLSKPFIELLGCVYFVDRSSLVFFVDYLTVMTTSVPETTTTTPYDTSG